MAKTKLSAAIKVPPKGLDRPSDVVLGLQSFERDIQAKFSACGGVGIFGNVVSHRFGTHTLYEHGYIMAKSGAPGGAVEVHGAIFATWRDLGGLGSYLGKPTSDEVPFDKGRANTFDSGGIYWWPDLGATDLRSVSISYAGMYCEDETDGILGAEDGDDETYVVISHVAASLGAEGYGTRTTRIEDGVEDDTARADLLEIYNGPLNGITLNVLALEQDHGSPDDLANKVRPTVQLAHEQGVEAMKIIPWAGAELAEKLGPELAKLVPEWARWLGDLLGDDLIGTKMITLSPRQMVEMATQTTNRQFQRIGYKFDTGNMHGDGGSYNVYFGIVAT